MIPRILGVIGSGIDDDDILQKCLDILIFLTELKQVQNNEALLIENVSTLLCVLASERINRIGEHGCGESS